MAVSSDTPDLLIVAGDGDAVAAEIQAFLSENGRRADILSTLAAAQLFTINVDEGTACVEPDIPLLLRPDPHPEPWPDHDSEFLHQECQAQLFSAAALMRSPVFNRPHPGLLYAVSPSAVLTAARAGCLEPDHSVEVFATRIPEPPDPQGEQWWVQNLPTGTTAAWPVSPGEGPYRARWSAADPAFEIVVVFADRAWHCTTIDLSHLDLEARSLAATNRLGINLAALTWRIGPYGKAADLVTIDPFPALEELRMVWLGFGPRLLEVVST